MRKLELEKMEKIQGGQFRNWRSRGCIDAGLGLATAVGSSFLGPAGIFSGLIGFATFVNHIGECA